MNSVFVRLATCAVVGITIMACTDGSDTDQPASPSVEEPVSDDVLDDNYEREEAEARARAVLGRSEEEVETSTAARLVRRGEEHFVVTMDLRPGRLNIELDEDADGTYVVTRVVVETPDGEDPLVIE